MEGVVQVMDKIIEQGGSMPSRSPSPNLDIEKIDGSFLLGPSSILKSTRRFTLGPNIEFNIGSNIEFKIGSNIEVNIGFNIGSNIGFKIGSNSEANIGFNIESDIGSNIEFGFEFKVHSPSYPFFKTILKFERCRPVYHKKCSIIFVNQQ